MLATGRFGRTLPLLSTRVQVGVALTWASGLTCTRPSSVPAPTASPPPTPIADTTHPRAPLGAAPRPTARRSGGTPSGVPWTRWYGGGSRRTWPPPPLIRSYQVLFVSEARRCGPLSCVPPQRRACSGGFVAMLESWPSVRPPPL